jgi:hypothetical protein
MVPVGAEIRCRVGSPGDRGLLLRRGERLVDFEAHQETDPQHDHHPCVAPELRPLSRRLDRLACEGLLELHQGRRRAAGADSMGRAPALQHRVR